MRYEELTERVITDGIAAARADYADKPDHLRGAVAGFEACRGKAPLALVELWKEANQRCEAARREQATDYWYHRCFQLEVEWLCNVVSVGLVQSGVGPLLGWLPTARAAMKYAEIVGVQVEHHVLQ